MTALVFVAAALCVVLLAALAMTPEPEAAPAIDTSRGTRRD